MEPIDRRGFLFAAGAATATLSTASPASPQTRNNGAVFLSTWDFGVEANRRAGEICAAVDRCSIQSKKASTSSRTIPT